VSHFWGALQNAIPCPSRSPIPAGKAELSILLRSGTFYFALTQGGAGLPDGRKACEQFLRHRRLGTGNFKPERLFPLMRFRSIADRSCKLLRSFLVVLSAVGAEPQALRFFGVLQIGQQPLIAEIEWSGILPIR
jgi:hypothetical protein